MEDSNTTPLIILVFFLIRCLIPLVVMLGVSYLLKKLGLISSTPKPPPERNDINPNSNHGNGGLAHV